MPALQSVTIGMRIVRDGKEVFSGSTGRSALKRTGAELVSWLGRENSFPHGAILLTAAALSRPSIYAGCR